MKFGKLITNAKDDILSRSTKAVYGPFEREIIVRSNRVTSTKALLRRNGFIVLGTGPAGPGSKKIWFNPAGVNL